MAPQAPAFFIPHGLFVGRQNERQLLLTAGGAYWTSAEIIPITADLTSEDLIG
jgi:hypothetical protein